MEGPSGFGGRMPRGEGLAKKKARGRAVRVIVRVPVAAVLRGQVRVLRVLHVGVLLGVVPRGARGRDPRGAVATALEVGANVRHPKTDTMEHPKLP